MTGYSLARSSRAGTLYLVLAVALAAAAVALAVPGGAAFGKSDNAGGSEQGVESRSDSSNAGSSGQPQSQSQPAPQKQETQTTTPQPPSNADFSGHGANVHGPYDSTRDGSPSGNGNGGGKATGKPCAGCVGKADNKNPPGQLPNGSDANAGYECDRNHGIGRTNPAHTGCTTTTTTTTTPSTSSSSPPGDQPTGGRSGQGAPPAQGVAPDSATGNPPASDVKGEDEENVPDKEARALSPDASRELPFSGFEPALIAALGVLSLLLGVAARRTLDNNM